MIKPNPEWQAAFNYIEQTLPQRPLKLKHVGDGNLLKQVCIIIALFSGAILLLFFTFDNVKDIIKDRKLVDNYVVLDNAKLHGQCEDSSNRYFFEKCEVVISYQDQKIKKEFDFISFNSSSSNDDLQVIAQKDDPSNISFNLAINVLKSRIITNIGYFIFALVTFWWGYTVITNVPKQGRVKKIMNDPANQPWQIIAMPVSCDIDSMEFTTDIYGEETDLTIDLKHKKPLIISPMNDKNWVLAVKAKQTNTSVPLTTSLHNIDLSRQEKKEVKAMINKFFG
ncbi:hypothetical protein [Psychrobacter sp. I-STPA10]|uniref:hypothetical protein n=1 Tax=Psychrobacter sp. I-STPA10 TaxID=2585769 RepID=UPI001E5EF907|nr:hypothetical protein [Psychrobacter sp. I-STPA10]